MARLLRDHKWLTPGEERTAEYLRDRLPRDWLVIAGRDLVDPSGSVCEIDIASHD